jgi:hypothetical protein
MVVTGALFFFNTNIFKKNFLVKFENMYEYEF